MIASDATVGLVSYKEKENGILVEEDEEGSMRRKLCGFCNWVCCGLEFG